MAKVKVVLNRSAFSEEVLHKSVSGVLDNVDSQMRSMASHRAVKVYRNDGGDRGSVVATAPKRVEAVHGVLSRMLGGVSV